ncbi:MAG: sigma-54 dependent transcriptional regulator [Pseudomonadota bacterium]
MPEEATILIVDDEESNVLSLQKIFSKEGYNVLSALNGKDGLDLLRGREVDVVLADLLMPGMSGVELLRAARALSPEVEFVLMTAHGTVETAVEAMKDGAYDFVEKPLKRMGILKVAQKALEKRRLVLENKSLRSQLRSSVSRDMIGNSHIWRQTLDLSRQAAASMANVLIQGESGTGKEILARFIHANSDRKGKPFIAVNCAAIPETIIEAELFGYEKGAFTGAVTKREGYISQANDGTLLLDEVGEIPLQVQVKLLRVLQEGEYNPLGGRQRTADFRLITSTNKDLHQEMADGKFRDDLFYRINVVEISCPPLRHRKDDIPILTDYFRKKFASRDGKDIADFTEQAMKRLIDYSWPGNIKELENTVERAVVLTKSNTFDVSDLPKTIIEENAPTGTIQISIGTSLEEIERVVIRETLKKTDGDKKLAAHLLGIAPRTIYRKLESL